MSDRNTKDKYSQKVFQEKQLKLLKVKTILFSEVINFRKSQFVGRFQIFRIFQKGTDIKIYSGLGKNWQEENEKKLPYWAKDFFSKIKKMEQE